MKPLGWRFVVVTDVGVDATQTVRVTPADPDGWLKTLGAGASVPAKSGGASVRMAVESPAAFAPEAVAAWLAAQGAPNGADAIDAVLHHPAFQRVESAWRGVKFLLEQTGDAIEVTVASLPRKNLAARFRETVFEPARWADEPTSLLICDHDFSHKGDGIATLTELGKMAGALQAPVLGNATAEFFDMRFLVQTANLGEFLPRLMDNTHANWRTWQATDTARWVVLTMNRVLQRAPYTSDNGGHAEKCAESNPDSYLFGRGVWLMAAAVARSVKQYGHGLAIAGSQGGRFDGLPVRAYPNAANSTVDLACEAAIAEQQVMELSRFGFTPITGALRANLAMVVSAMTVFRLKPTKPTLEGTLAYQLMAARLAQQCGRMLDAMPDGDTTAGASFFRTELTSFLGPLAGDKPDDAVKVDVVEEEMDGKKVPLAAIKVAPNLVLEGKPADFSFLLPLTR